MGVPQWIMIALLLLMAATDIARINGWEVAPPGKALMGFRVLFRPMFYGGLLFWGGFFS